MENIDFGTESLEPNQRLAHILYQVWGQSKVYDAVLEGQVAHDRWGYCEPCDCESPFLNDECLVCGSEFSEDNHQNTESENYPIKERGKK